MGCSQSAAVLEKPVQKQSQKQPALKPKPEISPHFLLGHIAQSEYLFAKINLSNRSIDRLTIPLQFQPYNFSSMLELDHKQYFISGGIDHSLKNITNNCWIYDSNTHSAKTIHSMHQARYTHAAIYLNQQVYVFGGRFFGQDDIAILSSCEVYSLKNNAWNPLPSMNIKRCTCYAMHWKESIFVFGGYTGPYERSEKIQKLNIKLGKWEILNFQLNRGIESSYVTSFSPNEVTIFGGNTNSGPTASVITINFQTQTVISHRHLKQPKMLHKSFIFTEQVYIFGGSDKGDLQIYDINQNKSNITNFNLNSQFSPQVFESLTYSQKSLILKHQKQIKKSFEHSQTDDIILIFGTTQEPFIFELNVSIPSTSVIPVPLSLKLYAEAGGIHLNNDQYMLFGGIEDDSLSSVTADSYIYNHNTRSAIKIASMASPRYSFAYLKIDNQVFVLGGGASDPDGNLILLDTCQVFNLITTKQWSSICSLPIPLISSSTLCYANNIYLFGGLTQSKKRNKQIFKYSLINDQWTPLNFNLPFGIEAASLYQYRHNEFYIFGGRLDNGDTDKIYNLTFIQQQVECAFIQKGIMNQRKNNVKLFKPKNQSFIVCLGGDKNVVSYYDVETLKEMQWDGLRRLKQIFTQQIQNLNSTNMKTYLAIPSSLSNK